MLFAQITDIHITMQTPSPFANRCPEKQLNKIVEYLNAMNYPPKFVFITGDCVDEGSTNEYAILHKALSQLNMPYYLIPGNHDSRENLRKTFPELAMLSQDQNFIQFVIDDYPVRLIGIDTMIEGAIVGELCEKRLDWLHKTLSQHPEKPTLLFMHHPPITCGINILDEYAYQNVDKLAKVLSHHSQVKHIFCGHSHRTMQALWHGISVTVVGSSVIQVNPDFSQNPQLKWSAEPPAFALHWWQPDKKSLTTQFCSVPVVA